MKRVVLSLGLVAAFFGLSTVEGYAQSPGTINPVVIGDLVNPYGQDVMNSNGYGYRPNTIGTPFLIDEWRVASIITNEGQTFKDIKVRYDILHDVLIAEIEKNQERQIATQLLKSFSIKGNGLENDRSFVRLDVPGYEGNFFEVVYENDKGGVYYHNKKKIVQGAQASGYNYNSKAADDKFVMQKVVVVKVGSQVLVGPKKRKDLNSLFALKLDEMVAYMKKNKVSTKNTDELMETLRYYKGLF